VKKLTQIICLKNQAKIIILILAQLLIRAKKILKYLTLETNLYYLFRQILLRSILIMQICCDF